MRGIQAVGKSEIVMSLIRSIVEVKSEPEVSYPYRQTKSEVRQIIIGVARSLAVVKG